MIIKSLIMLLADLYTATMRDTYMMYGLYACITPACRLLNAYFFYLIP
jgi:hypothetical protein